MLLKLSIVCFCLLAVEVATSGASWFDSEDYDEGYRRMETDKSKISAMLTERGKKMDTYLVSDYLHYLGPNYKDSKINDVHLLLAIGRQEPARCSDPAVYDRLMSKYDNTPLKAYIRWEQYYVGTYCKHLGMHRARSGCRSSLRGRNQRHDIPGNLENKQEISKMLTEKNPKVWYLTDTVLRYLQYLGPDYRDSNIDDVDTLLSLVSKKEAYCPQTGVIEKLKAKYRGSMVGSFVRYQESAIDSYCDFIENIYTTLRPRRLSDSIW